MALENIFYATIEKRQIPICQTDAAGIFPQRFRQFPAPAFRVFPAAPGLDFGVMWMRLVFLQTV